MREQLKVIKEIVSDDLKAGRNAEFFEAMIDIKDEAQSFIHLMEDYKNYDLDTDSEVSNRSDSEVSYLSDSEVLGLNVGDGDCSCCHDCHPGYHCRYHCRIAEKIPKEMSLQDDDI